jgi:hypothetical protein
MRRNRLIFLRQRLRHKISGNNFENQTGVAAALSLPACANAFEALAQAALDAKAE